MSREEGGDARRGEERRRREGSEELLNFKRLPSKLSNRGLPRRRRSRDRGWLLLRSR
jgi:hypothetical protein